MTEGPSSIAAASVALAWVRYLSASVEPVVDARGMEARTLFHGLVVETFPRVDPHWCRLFQEGTLVLDGRTVDGMVVCHAFVPGPWLARLDGLASAGERADATSHERRARGNENERTRVRSSPISNSVAKFSARRLAFVNLATIVVARGERMDASPGIHVERLGVHLAAAGRIGGLVLVSVHTPRGMEIIAAGMDRSWPHRLRWARGRRDLLILSSLRSIDASITDGDRVAFRAFCEGDA